MTPTLISTGPGFREFVAAAGDNTTPNEVLSAASDFHTGGFATHEDTEAASDFDVASATTPRPAPAVPVAAAPTPAKAQSNFSSAASLTAPDPDAPLLAAERAGRVDGVWAKLRSDLAGLTAPIKAGCAEVRAARQDLHKRGLSSPQEAQRRIEDLDKSHDGLSAAELANRASEIARLGSITRSMCMAAQRPISIRVHELINAAHGVLDAAESRLAEYLETALESERQFFAGHGLPHTRTAVSHRIESAQRTLQRMRSNFPPRRGEEGHPWHDVTFSSEKLALNFDVAGVLGELAK